jgi:small subunit ribosomal protein S8
MNLNCTLSDAIARINNAKNADSTTVSTITSKKTTAILQALSDHRIIKGFVVVNDRITEVQLYPTGGFRKLRICSTPGRVMHLKARNLLPTREHGFQLISTSAGIMTTKEARNRGIGGKLVLQIWL